jgi:UPF0716 protein FxsA
MRRMLFIVATLLVVAAVEIAVLILIGQAIGAVWTILLVLATSALGGWLLRREGARAWRAFRADLAEGRPPGNAATDGVLVFVGGVLMLVPGFVTAAIGALLLIPPVRRLSRVVAVRVFGRRISAATATSLFGPRKVRVRYGAPQHPEPDKNHGDTGPGNGPSVTSGRDTIVDSEPIEGEIIDPR